MLPCRHCAAWVTPEREHLAGWQGATSQIEARKAGKFSCPACGKFWSEEDRGKANAASVLLHRNQTLDEAGHAQGDLPATDTLGFRWSGANNLFVAAGDMAADEWKTWVHERIKTPMDHPGALTLFKGAPQDDLALSKHLTAETKTEEFVAGIGVVVKWERQQRQNHWRDALYNACAAARYCGAKLITEKPRTPRPARTPYPRV